ncbi:MAG: PD-(D/E)XK nuclease family protein, partial [Verrucomicrobiota bacterium]
PFRSDAYFLKTRLLEAGLHALGIHFMTPSELREELIKRLVPHQEIPLREHLQLLLAVAAESILETGTENAASLAAAHAVAGAPDHLLHAIDQLSGGGWDFTETGPPALRPIVQEFNRLLRRCEFQPVHEVDRELLRRAKEMRPLFSDLFLAGFSGANWPILPLLSAAVFLAENATVSLLDPRPEAEELDSTWVGTWEETFGSAEPVAMEEPGSFADTLRLPESPREITRRQEHPAEGIQFLVGQNTREQAHAIVGKAMQFLSEQNCTRLGILLPAGGALARMVSSLLAEQEITHNDTLAHFAPGPFETPAWSAWLALQENPRIEGLMRFLRVHPCETLFEGLDPETIESGLRQAFSEVLIDDLQLLVKVLASDTVRESAPRIAQGIRSFPLLSEHAPFSEFILQTDAIFQQLDWRERAGELRRLSAHWSHRIDHPLSRRAYLRWLGQVLVSMQAERDPAGNHPYSRVQLLPYTQAETQPWSHLILAGLNENGWPQPFDDSGYIGEEEIDALNRRIRVLNEGIIRQGRQGEGHWALLPGKALCLGPVQKRDLTLRQFLNTLESVSSGIVASASLSDEAQPARALNPSDFFTRLYFCARGKAVSLPALGALREETVRWLEGGRPAAFRESRGFRAVRQTRLAFDARRDSGQPFGEYEFALREKLTRPLKLSATRWERALIAPASVWMQHLLGVTARNAGDNGDGWSQATGQWVHRWLGSVSTVPFKNTFVPMPGPVEIVTRTRAHAEAFRAAVDSWLRAVGRDEVPDWWLSGWRQALSTADALARRLAEATEGRWMATEWNVYPMEVELAPDKTLHLHGRIDLILGGDAPSEATGLPLDPWMIDYKTGAKKTLDPRSKIPGERAVRLAGKFAAGESLQLALYALALRQHGAATLGISLLTPELALDAPQIDLHDINALQTLWLGLHRMQESGVFGIRGSLRDEFSFHRIYPLATLPIDPALLAEKWRLTHPAFSEAGEEDFQ